MINRLRGSDQGESLARYYLRDDSRNSLTWRLPPDPGTQQDYSHQFRSLGVCEEPGCNRSKHCSGYWRGTQIPRATWCPFLDQEEKLRKITIYPNYCKLGKRHQKTDTSWHSIAKNSILTQQIEGSLKFLQMKKINVSPCARTSPWHHWDLELYVNWIQHVISECSSLPQSEHKSRLRSVMHLEELLTGPFEWPRVNQTSFI